MKKRFAIVILLFGFLSGCTSSPSKPLDPASNSVTAVSFSKNVSMPLTADYSGPGVSLGAALGGVIGGLIANSDTSGDKILTTYMYENKIDVEKMLADEFQQQLANSLRFNKIVPEGDADAEFKLRVMHYGLVKGWGIFKVQPTMKLNATLINKEGTLLWEKTVVEQGFDDEYAKQPLEVWISDPQELDKGFQTASKKLVELLIMDLNK